MKTCVNCRGKLSDMDLGLSQIRHASAETCIANLRTLVTKLEAKAAAQGAENAELRQKLAANESFGEGVD